MKIKEIIKKNLFGFVLGAILFGGISIVFATSIASSTIAYTTTNNNNVETVEDAIMDLQERILGYPIECYNGVCGKLSYRYWNNNFAGASGANLFDSTHMPANNYATRALLEQNYSYFADAPVYIRSILIDGNVVGHESCFWEANNQKEFCLAQGYWAGTLGTTDATVGTNTKIKLQREMQNALGVTIEDNSCYSEANYALCVVGGFNCYVYYSGVVYCNSYATTCNVGASGSAYCS